MSTRRKHLRAIPKNSTTYRDFVATGSDGVIRSHRAAVPAPWVEIEHPVAGEPPSGTGPGEAWFVDPGRELSMGITLRVDSGLDRATGPGRILHVSLSHPDRAPSEQECVEVASLFLQAGGANHPATLVPPALVTTEGGSAHVLHLFVELDLRVSEPVMTIARPREGAVPVPFGRA